MTSIYSKRFLLNPDNTTNLYTVPAGMVAVLRSVTGSNEGNTAGYLVCYLQSPRVYFVMSQLDPVNTLAINTYSRNWDLRVVLQAGEQLGLQTSANVSGSASGYLFAS